MTRDATECHRRWPLLCRSRQFAGAPAVRRWLALYEPNGTRLALALSAGTRQRLERRDLARRDDAGLLQRGGAGFATRREERSPSVLEGAHSMPRSCRGPAGRRETISSFDVRDALLSMKLGETAAVFC